MNDEECTAILNKILGIDKVFSEHQLGHNWKEPLLKPLTQHDLPSYRSAVELMNNEHNIQSDRTMMPKTASTQSTINKNNKTLINRNDKKLFADKRVLRMILRYVAEESGFFIEDSLATLLDSYIGPQSTLIKIDHIFQVRKQSYVLKKINIY